MDILVTGAASGIGKATVEKLVGKGHEVIAFDIDEEGLEDLPDKVKTFQGDVYDEEKGEWVGLGGAGMFRPEVVKPLLGFEVPVLAWGLGPGRIIMKKHGIDDMREMYRNDLELLRDAE
ncbi:MAG: SDR family NAD(P)-dependent oxidoreductase, partial [Candidatus Aenigmatarchaeota archaeon]